VQQSVVLIESGHGHGAGVIWDGAGLIITNHHVVGQDRAVVELADGRRLAGTVVARDRENDLAALQVAADGLPPVPVGDSRRLRLGELIVAVGHPFGVRGAVTMGIVSALGNATWMGPSRRELLQADLALAPGNSGGPLVDCTGAVVGVASMVISPGIALAVPSHVVGHFVAGVQVFRCSDRTCLNT
jgi:serine protease Do